MKSIRTKEKQYNSLIKISEKFGETQMGLMSNFGWKTDPMKLVFSSSRYKFVSRMLKGKSNVLEVGSGDGFYSRIVKQSVKNLTICDFDEIFIKDFQKKNDFIWKINSLVHDMIKKPIKKKYDAIYFLDVLEHINKKNESRFIKNCILSMKRDGVVICGIPSLVSQKYASEESKMGHVNCKNGDELKKTFEKYFHNTFIFSMNDEVVHTGYFKMAHYLMCVATGLKKRV
jgi:2-polyprenyl-3-methyl-5-hydroxy-6-metoxy-1,4-benzoquinol methylase